MDKIHRYVDIHDNPSDAPEGIRTNDKGIFREKFDSHEDYLIAQSCCNFEVKKREGYCVTLYEPYYLFKKPCKDCPIFQALKQDYMRRQAMKKQRKEAV